MRIFNARVYGLEESLVRSGYPMRTKMPNEYQFADETFDLVGNKYHKSFKRGIKLGAAPIGSGHDKFLRGIIVQFDMIAPRYFWQEWDTYHFAESISSQSTLHCLLKFDVSAICNKYVLPETIERFQKLLDAYKDNPTLENFLIAKSNLPEGLEVGRGVSTNYQQLKTIYSQRKNHKLPEWREIFCPWVKSLPYATELGVVFDEMRKDVKR